MQYTKPDPGSSLSTNKHVIGKLQEGSESLYGFRHGKF